MIARICLLFLATAAASSAQYLRGVNVAGAEFGETVIPGTIGQTHTYNSARTFQYFASRSLGFIRLAVRWERLQPVLRGPLDTTNLNALKQDIQWAKAAGCQISIDIHNYARYKMNEAGTLNTYTIDNVYNGSVKVSAADLADFWVRMSNEFKDEQTVYAYDLMNEPHDMATASWRTISQTAVSAIRANGDGKLIMVPGDNWSAAQTWVKVHGPTSWISDPMNNFLYEAHQYFDSDNSGTYARTYDQELAANTNLPMIGPARLAPFINWCKTNNVGCYLGEYGIPNDDSRWNTVLDNFLTALDAAGLDGTYWAAGEWWGKYALSVQPLNNFTTDRVQIPTLLSHLAPGAFTSVPAAALWGYSVAPGSLVSGFGTNLAGSGTQIQLTDSAGSISTAQILSNSENQVNYLVPVGTPPGRVDVVVTNGKAASTGVLEIEPIAPTLFSANNDGKGVAAALVLRVKADGTQTYENIAQFDQSRNQFVVMPLSFSGDRLFLTLFGTGFAGGTARNATLVINSVNLPVSYAGPQNQYPGLDQVNAELPALLAGSGEVTVSFAVGGKPSNPVTIGFR